MKFIILFAPFQPSPGLAIWTLVIFLLFWYIVGKLAFKPIVKALNDRELDIQSSLDEAKKAKEEMSNMRSENEKLLQQAREERAALLNEAKETKNSIIAEAREKAKEEAAKIVASAQVEIENQKKAALAEVKSEVGSMAIDIAEKLLQTQLLSELTQQNHINDLVKQISRN